MTYHELIIYNTKTYLTIFHKHKAVLQFTNLKLNICFVYYIYIKEMYN